MSAPLSLVRERPLDERPSENPTCPFCRGRHLDRLDSRTTLLGGGDRTIDGDPNHVWTTFRCHDCFQQFVRETKSGNTWYTRDGRVLRGLPSCFESYIYHCATCGGDVMRRNVDKDGVEVMYLITDNVNGRPVRRYRTLYACAGCHAEVEVDE